MKTVKFTYFYLNLYVDCSYKWDKMINILTAIASSSSIAGWAIWNRLNFIWGGIIAASQVIGAVKPYLPFSKRLKLLEPCSYQIDNFYHQVEYKWLDIASGAMTEGEINACLLKYQTDFSGIQNKYMSDINMPENSKFQKAASNRGEEYFKLNFLEVNSYEQSKSESETAAETTTQITS